MQAKFSIILEQEDEDKKDVIMVDYTLVLYRRTL